MSLFYYLSKGPFREGGEVYIWGGLTYRGGWEGGFIIVGFSASVQNMCNLYFHVMNFFSKSVANTTGFNFTKKTTS